MIVLRPDQQAIKDGIYNCWNNGQPNVLAVLPTGGGKSIIVSQVALDIFPSGSSQAIIAHRNELVSQMSIHLANRGIPHRLIASDKTIKQITRLHRKIFGKSFVNPSSKTAVVGVDTLISRIEELSAWAAQVSYWIIDEAHHVLKENKWGKAVSMFPRALGLGVTATPCRADGKGLGRDYEGVFDAMIIGPEMRYLIQIGALSDYEIVCPTSDLEIEDEDVGKDGDWSSQKLKKAAKKSHIIGDVLRGYCRFAWGRKAIIFATDVETAGDIANQFNDAGIRAASVSAKTDSAVREKYIEEFKTGKILILINVDLFDEGFDVPACDVVVMARPTASLGKYRQMVGRALRFVPGKVALIIDHVSNIRRHKYPDLVTQWSLARRDKRGKLDKDPDEIDLRVCHECTRPYERFLTACPHCGAEIPLPEPRDRSIKTVDGDLILLDRATLAEMRRATIMETPASIGDRVGAVAGDFAARGVINKQIEKFAAHDRLKNALAQWAGIERHKGLSDREIQKKFYLTTGIDVLTALDATQARQQLELLATRIEGWYSK
jgi:DNA repair protein RadD